MDIIKQAAVKMDENQIKEKIDEGTKMNRAQRRALMKKAGKQGRGQIDLVSDTAKKLAYIQLIQDLRKLNENGDENNGTISDEN